MRGGASLKSPCSPALRFKGQVRASPPSLSHNPFHKSLAPHFKPTLYVNLETQNYDVKQDRVSLLELHYTSAIGDLTIIKHQSCLHAQKVECITLSEYKH